jgi:hypothetical protein
VYGYDHPAQHVATKTRVTHELDGSSLPLDMDECYTDKWLQHEIAASILRKVAGLRDIGDEFLGPAPRRQDGSKDYLDKLVRKYTWISPDVKIEFPNLGDNWREKAPRRQLPFY